MPEPFVPPVPLHQLSHRDFLQGSAPFEALVSFLPERVPGDLYARSRTPRRTWRPVRVRGVVRTRDRGVGRGAASDGIRVVHTAAGGTFDLISSTAWDHVFLYHPWGDRIPVNPTGTARFYLPVTPDSRDETEAIFDLEQPGIPSFAVVGNHNPDCRGPTAESSTRTLPGRRGPRYHRFNRGRVHHTVPDKASWVSAGYVDCMASDRFGAVFAAPVPSSSDLG